MGLIDVHADSRPLWIRILSAFVIGFKRFLFNVLLFLGSLPEEDEPEMSCGQPEKRRADSGRS
jgi:hypothetical protein